MRSRLACRRCRRGVVLVPFIAAPAERENKGWTRRAARTSALGSCSARREVEGSARLEGEGWTRRVTRARCGAQIAPRRSSPGASPPPPPRPTSGRTQDHRADTRPVDRPTAGLPRGSARGLSGASEPSSIGIDIRARTTGTGGPSGRVRPGPHPGSGLFLEQAISSPAREPERAGRGRALPVKTNPPSVGTKRGARFPAGCPGVHGARAIVRLSLRPLPGFGSTRGERGRTAFRYPPLPSPPPLSCSQRSSRVFGEVQKKKKSEACDLSPLSTPRHGHVDPRLTRRCGFGIGRRFWWLRLRLRRGRRFWRLRLPPGPPRPRPRRRPTPPSPRRRPPPKDAPPAAAEATATLSVVRGRQSSPPAAAAVTAALAVVPRRLSAQWSSSPSSAVQRPATAFRPATANR